MIIKGKTNDRLLRAYDVLKGADKSKMTLGSANVQEARRYIENFWVNLERYNPKDQDTLLGLPKPYLVPAHDPTSSFNFDEMYYWDSYFMVQGMLSDPNKKELVMGILENLCAMLRRFKVIPNASRTYLMGRSQPPLLTSFIFDVYDAYGLDTRWLAKMIQFAKDEYHQVWMGQQKPHDRLVHQGLSRYYDINVLHDLAEAESGWDMTDRFGRQCLDYLPVDLNALLYKYETDFARAAEIMKSSDEQVKWERAALRRCEAVEALMWNKQRGLYFDYNYATHKRGSIASLASFLPLWAGMVSKERAQILVKNLSVFEAKGGLTTTTSKSLQVTVRSKTPTQWAYPNGWAPLHFFVIEGLRRYGFESESQRIATKWLRTNLNWFNVHGVFLEKYNVAQPHKPPVEGVYPTQSGFGWTNAVFERLCQDYIDSEK